MSDSSGSKSNAKQKMSNQSKDMMRITLGKIGIKSHRQYTPDVILIVRIKGSVVMCLNHFKRVGFDGKIGS